MKALAFVGLLIGLLVTACGPSPIIEEILPSATSPPPDEPTPIPTVDLSIPETVGVSFLEAWTRREYETMHALLTPELRAGLTLESFTRAYETPLNTTTTISITVLPRALNVDRVTQRAWIEFTTIWHTGVFGDLQANNQLNLVEEDGAWWVDWRRATIWPDLMGDNAFVVEYQIPPRANIYDHAGAGLAIPSTIVTVGVIPGNIQDEAAVLGTLSQVLEMSQEAIRAIYANQPTNWFIPIREITGEQSLAHDSQLTLPGIQRRERTGRIYPLTGVAAHVVGWISPIPAEDYDAYRRQGYRGDERVGISGLEAVYERVLAGQNGGRLYLVDGEGKYLGGIAERRPERGRAIYTTLDRALQQSAEQTLGQRRGAIVALDVHTGAVRALTSGPIFDNNVFIRTTDTATLRAVVNDPDLPLLNRATQGTYPVGSVFKIVTMAAGLEAGGLTAQSSFYCSGHWDGLGEASRKRCWLETGHGAITLADGLTASCNVTFYEVGRQVNSVGPEVLPTYGRAFGLGTATGLQALREAGGLMPDPEWKLNTYRERWAMGDTIHLAIGQGYLLVTPLQVAQMTAAVANGGTLYRPYLIDHITEGSGHPVESTQPEARGNLPITANHLAAIQAAMRSVTTASHGTATHRFQGLGIPVAGKTGTAETDGTARPHSWFVGYFPADNPQIAMVVMVESAGEGSTVAAPMFRQVIERYYGLPVTPLP